MTNKCFCDICDEEIKNWGKVRFEDIDICNSCFEKMKLFAITQSSVFDDVVYLIDHQSRNSKEPLFSVYEWPRFNTETLQVTGKGIKELMKSCDMLKPKKKEEKE